MGVWGTALFSDDLALDVKGEYSVLLSMGKENAEVEQLLCKYYQSILDCNDPDEDIFWLVLARCEWEKGRLSEFVKSKALLCLERGNDLQRWNTSNNQKNYKKRKKVLEDLKNMILSPAPPPTKVRKLTVCHCPWRVGSLLAYRIVTNKEVLADHPCFMKYVLLRVIKIQKHPISSILPSEYYDESMLVGVYGWIGDEIPSLEIVKELEFIPIEVSKPDLSVKSIGWSVLKTLDEPGQLSVLEMLKNCCQEQVETCVDLDWTGTRNEKGDITFLEWDSSFEEKIPDFFNTDICSYSLTHFRPFDVTLANRFESYYKKIER